MGYINCLMHEESINVIKMNATEVWTQEIKLTEIQQVVLSSKRVSSTTHTGQKD